MVHKISLHKMKLFKKKQFIPSLVHNTIEENIIHNLYKYTGSTKLIFEHKNSRTLSHQVNLHPRSKISHQKVLNLVWIILFSTLGSDRSSRNAYFRQSVYAWQTCQEQSIFNFLGQRALREPLEHSESVK